MELYRLLQRFGQIYLFYQILDNLEPRKPSIRNGLSDDEGRIGLDDCLKRPTSQRTIAGRISTPGKIRIQGNPILQ